MLNGIANRHTECEQQDLTSSIKYGAKDNITNWPSVFQCTEDKDKLGDDVDGDADKRPENVDYEERDGLGE